MSILTTELKKYGAASRPEDDVSLSGGAIDVTCILDVTQMAATDTLQIVSDNAVDTAITATIKGRDAGGAIITDTKTLNGTTQVSFSGTFERFLTVTLSSAATGTVTVSRVTGGASVAVLPAGVTSAVVQFIDAASEAAQTVRYAKEFWTNESAESFTLTAAKLQLTADPSASIKIGVATAKGDAVTIANRKTAPSGVTFVDDAVEIDVPGQQLEAAANIGVWVEMTRSAGAAALKSSYTTQLAGSSI